MTSSQTQSQFKTVRDIFEQEYIIPEYQRGYAWEEKHCEQLWNDLVAFENDRKKNKINEKENYFLGTIIFSKKDSKNKNIFYVVDGQQRLITLLLLLRALQEVAESYKVDLKNEKLKEIFSKKSSEQEPRINFEALKRAEDNEEFQRILVSGEEGATQESSLKQNYQKLKAKIIEAEDKELDLLIAIVLDRIHLFPIEFDSQSQALTVFETINDRGTTLNNADIFKAKIYTACIDEGEKEKKKIIKRWDDLEAHEWLFEVYLHIFLAKEEKLSLYKIKKINLRNFFLKDKQRLWTDYSGAEEVMNDLEKLCHIHRVCHKYDSITDSNEVWWKILKWWRILGLGTSKYHSFPLFVFLYKHFDDIWKKDNGDFILKQETEIANQFEKLIEWTARYFFIRGVNGRLSDDVRRTTYEVYRAIYHHGEGHLEKYQDNLAGKRNHFIDFRENINKWGNTGHLKRCRSGIVFIGAALNEKQDNKNFCDRCLDEKGVQVEHIFPKKWKREYGNKSWAGDYIENPGNLIPCEGGINGEIKNSHFRVKRNAYKNSDIQDLKFLSEKKRATWERKDIEDRGREIKERLLKFFVDDYLSKESEGKEQ